MTDTLELDTEVSDRRGSGATEEVTVRYTRSPQDVLRLVAFAFAALVLAIITIAIEDALLAFEEDLVELLDFLSPQAARIVYGVGAVIWIVAVAGVYLTPLVTRRYRLFGYIMLASLSAFGLTWLTRELVDREASTVLVNEVARRAGLDDSEGRGIGIAQMAAMFIAVGPFVNRMWRRAGSVVIVFVTLMGVFASTELPAEAFLALPIGALCGSAVLLAFGRPDRRPTLGAISAALENAGLPVTEVHPASVDARGSTPYFATLADGSGLFVKVLGSQERAADLLFRIYRFLRFRDVGDDRPFSSLRRAIEHEALIALMARDIGVRTPRLRGVVDVGADSLLLAYDLVGGRSIDGLPDEEITDELMQGIWRQIAVLREHRIAHRDLRRANVFAGIDGTPWLIDFGFSEVAVDDNLLDADVAQMLASFVVVAGSERTVRAAVDVLGADAVGDSLHRLQVGACSGATQSALKDHKGLLKQLQDEVISQCGVAQVEYNQLDRVSKKTVLMIAVLALATYFLFPQFADLPGIVDQVEAADWSWTPLIILASAMTYVAASASLAGAIPDRLPAGPLLTATVGSSFASKLAPAGLGGMALNVRFLQKQGVDKTVAASGVGLNTVAGFAGHISLIGNFDVWAGSDAVGSFELPDPTYFLIGRHRRRDDRDRHAHPARPEDDHRPPRPDRRQGLRRRLHRAPPAGQGGAAARWVDAGHVLVPDDPLLQPRSVRRWASLRHGRRRLPGWFRRRPGCPHARRARCDGGGADRRPHRGGHRQRDRCAGCLPVSPVHVLGSDPAGLALFPMARAPRIPVMSRAGSRRSDAAVRK